MLNKLTRHALTFYRNHLPNEERDKFDILYCMSIAGDYLSKIDLDYYSPSAVKVIKLRAALEVLSFAAVGDYGDLVLDEVFGNCAAIMFSNLPDNVVALSIWDSIYLRGTCDDFSPEDDPVWTLHGVAEYLERVAPVVNAGFVLE
ncbi:hypothetical protein GW755_00015 [bacterium]|nr:hypothetical protein [bacterium]